MIAALMLGRQYVALGGSFIIQAGGKRARLLPEFDLAEVPQFAPVDRPWQRFQSIDEWRGAVRFIDALLDQLQPDEQSFVYDAIAEAAVYPDRLDPAVRRLLG